MRSVAKDICFFFSSKLVPRVSLLFKTKAIQTGYGLKRDCGKEVTLRELFTGHAYD